MLAASQSTISFAAKTRVSVLVRITAATTLILLGGCRSESDPPTSETSAVQPSLEPITIAEQEPKKEAEPPSREATLETADRLVQQNDFVGAVTSLRSLLVADPDDVEVIFRLASLTAYRGDLSAAIELLDAIPPDHPDAGLPALGQSADWCAELKRYDEAERRYLQVLERVPQAAEAHRKLAFLYNCQGRRHEAATQIYRLCELGNVRQDELHALIHLSDAMYDDPSSAPAPGQVLYRPIGPAAEARKLFMENRYQEAVSQLQDTVERGDAPASMIALYGRAAAEAQDDRRVKWWLTQTDATTEQFAEYWAALGLFLLSENKYDGAARALLEAVDRDPTDFRSISRLRSVMETLGNREEAVRWEQRWMQLRQVITENNQIAKSVEPNTEAMADLADMLDRLGRSLEAVLWRSMAGYHRKLPRESLLALNSQLRDIVTSGRGYPDRNTRLCNIELERFPLPKVESWRNVEVERPKAIARSDRKATPARFENVAVEQGLSHAYQVASSRLDDGFSVYQSVGGGVAVLDYDCDGRPDLYFAQGGADPPSFTGSLSNLLYRNAGEQLIGVTQPAAASEFRYSIGTTAGDWNQDGFPDLIVGNLGANSLLINNGDGTFTHKTLDNRDDKTLMTTSLALGDLTGDALPDVFELNYLHDPEIVKRPRKNAQGQVVESLMPQEFDPGRDRLVVNRGPDQPTFLEMGDAASAARAGLGVVVGNFDGQQGNEAFVGNDVYANQYWTREPDRESWIDVAPLRGCAYGSDGVKTASMGIAAGDLDGNGWLDFHITNFQDESVSLYVNEGGSFRDRNIQFGLAEPSKSVLGFGTQTIDYDNDGWLDLVVANGHIENAIGDPSPFHQPAQLFANLGGRFTPIDVTDDSGYWQADHLGRGLARVDINRDGKMDYVVTHLGDTSAVMLNRTESTHHWLQLCLTGTKSERDAIGVKVEIQVGGRRASEWLNAGDGFLARNEAVLAFGLGDQSEVEEVVITWPSGHKQTLRNLPADRRWLVIEEQPEAFELR